MIARLDRGRINWRKGFFRIWLLYCMFSVGVAAHDAYRDSHLVRCPVGTELPTVEQFFGPLAAGTPADVERACEAAARPWYYYVMVATASPILLLLAGLVIGWIGAAFSAAPSAETKWPRFKYAIRDIFAKLSWLPWLR